MILETLFDKFEEVLLLKENKIKNWEDIFPLFTYYCKKSRDSIASNPSLMNDLKKLLEYVKPLETLPDDRKNERFSNIKTLISALREKYLIDIAEEPDKFIVPNTDIKFIKGVGERKANLLHKLEIYDLQDTFLFAPREYEDRREIKHIINIKDQETVFICGKVANFDENKINEGLKILTYSLEDETGVINLVFFNQEYLKQTIKINDMMAVFGKAEVQFGKKVIKNAEFEIIESENHLKRELLPVYPLTYGLSQNSIRTAFREFVRYTVYQKEFIPKEITEKYKILDVKRRLKGIHFPMSNYHKARAFESMKIDEIVSFETAILYNKYKFKNTRKGIAKDIKGDYSKKLLDSLHFKLTKAQVKAYEEIKNDLMSEKVMNRLLQGDVGSGKTVVAELSCLDIIEAGYQAAFMVPTSVLAKQHYTKIKKHFDMLDLKTELLLGETKESEKKKIKERLKNKEIDLLIGTHAIIQEDVEFSNLGIIIIDEQHRFGVNQRLDLINKGNNPDILTMTATPIPRTLGLTLYGDLDISIINELPAGRKSIKTFLMNENNSINLYKLVEDELKQGNQAFFVYPLIEESEVLDLKSATEMYEIINERFKEYGAGLLHGRMTPQEKNEIMERFVNKEFSVLVSTTVIEVGVDIPDATVMVIEHPERFGLAQLHQLRGRVGRNSKQSFCFLVLGSEVNKETKEKLMQFSKTNDGFIVSELDLEWRGPGTFFGTQQSGLPEFKFMNIISDIELINEIRDEIIKIFEKDPELENYPEYRNEIFRRYSKKFKLIQAI